MDRNEMLRAAKAIVAFLESSLAAPAPGGGAPAPSRQGAPEAPRSIEPAGIPRGPITGQIKGIYREDSKSGKPQCKVILGWRQGGESYSAKFFTWDAAVIAAAEHFDKGDIVQLNVKPWRDDAGQFDSIARMG